MNIKYFISFVLGVLVGYGTAYGILNKKLDKKLKEHIELNDEILDDRIKELESHKCECNCNKISSEENNNEHTEEKTDSIKPIVRTFVDYSESYKNIKDGADDALSVYDPNRLGATYVIPPEDYGEDDEYIQIELTQYADGYIVDSDGDIFDNANKILPNDLADYYGEFYGCEDEIFLRNDVAKVEYNVVRDTRNYKNMKKQE